MFQSLGHFLLSPLFAISGSQSTTNWINIYPRLIAGNALLINAGVDSALLEFNGLEEELSFSKQLGVRWMLPSAPRKPWNNVRQVSVQMVGLHLQRRWGPVLSMTWSHRSSSQRWRWCISTTADGLTFRGWVVATSCSRIHIDMPLNCLWRSDDGCQFSF